MADTLLVPPDFAAPCETVPRLDRVQFGDGYAQVATHGINVLSDSWKLTFSNRKKSEVDEITAILRGSLGGYFLWTVPGDEVASKWRTTKPWQRVVTEYGWTLSCEIEQVF